jgi:glycerol-1-phosphate dehydrogenase [NAD(P)+]
MLSLYDWLLGQDIAHLDPAGTARRAADWEETEKAIRRAFDNENIAGRAVEEMRAKWIATDPLAARLRVLREGWPALRDRLAGHLMRADDMRELLATAGAPVTIGEIGLTPDRHRATVLKARWIRKRYTLLDMLADAGLLERAVAECFHAGHPLYA